MSSSTLTSLLSEEAIEILRAKGHKHVPVLRNGRRVVSNVSYMSVDSIDSEATVEIPEHLESLATLEFLEFRPDAANKLWGNIQAAEPLLPTHDFLDAVKYYIDEIPGDAHEDDDDQVWTDAATNMGLTRAFQDRLMDPEYKEMRLMGSLKDWVRWMVEERYHFLQSLDDFVKNPARGSNRRVSTLDLQTGKLVTGPVIPERSSSVGATPPVGHFSTNPSIATASSNAPRDIEGHATYFKWGTVARLESVHGSSTTNNRLGFVSIASTPPGDFSGDTRGLYFTKHERIAWQYVQWAGKLIDRTVVPVGILRVAIPDHLLASITEVVGEVWRRFVWANRRSNENPTAIDDLAYLKDFQWLTGPICGQSQHRVNRMENAGELKVWRMPTGESSSQIFSDKRAMMWLMGEYCVGKVWVTGISAQGR